MKKQNASLCEELNYNNFEITAVREMILLFSDVHTLICNCKKKTKMLFKQDFALIFEEDEVKFKQSITLTIFSLSCFRSSAGEETKAKLEIGSCKVLSREKAREKIKLHFMLHFKKSSTSHFIYHKDSQRVTKIFPENCPKKSFFHHQKDKRVAHESLNHLTIPLSPYLNMKHKFSFMQDH